MAPEDLGPLGPPPPPLQGLRIVDLTRLLPGDFATWVLADLGAEVIKVEDTGGGDYMRWMPPMVGHSSAMYRALNRGKKAIRVDLKQDAGRDILHRLIDTADALVEGFRPGVMERLGFGWETVHRHRPSLVYCAITGYGQDGPLAQRAGHDLGYNSLAGLIGVTGTASGELAIPGFQVADLAGGGLGGALSIVSALLARERDPEGRGTFLDVSMYDGVSAIIAPHLARYLAGEQGGGPGRMYLNGGLACYHLYRSQDDRWMALTALEPKFWKAFCKMVDRPDLLQRHLDTDADFIAEVAGIIAARPRAEWERLNEEHDAMLEPVLDFGEVPEHPQFKARGLAVDAGGDVPQPAPVVRWPDGHHADTRVAEQGEDTDAVLRELGFSDEKIQELRAASVI